MSLLPEEWQWVAVDSKGSSKDYKMRQTVRKNAMKSFRRNERLERSKNYMESRAKGKTTSKPRSLQPHPNVAILGSPSQTANSCREPVHNLVSSQPTTVLFDREAQRLWSHFINHIAVQLQPAGTPKECNAITTCLVPQALQHTGFTTSMLFHSGAHLDALLNRPWTRTTLFYRGETIRHIKEHLSSGGSESNDSLLAMVAFLAAEGNVNGDVNSDHLHTRAVQTMVQIRGGLSAMSLTQAPLAMSLSM
ncbi:hypothetical protein PSPO01_10319 [Paraphaeosphaeria sporulosa]